MKVKQTLRSRRRNKKPTRKCYTCPELKNNHSIDDGDWQDQRRQDVVAEQGDFKETGKKKVDSEPLTKAVNSAKKVEDVMDMGQGVDRLPGTSRTMTDLTMVSPIFMAGLKPAN